MSPITFYEAWGYPQHRIIFLGDASSVVKALGPLLTEL
jgi:hypothetical protein